MQINKGTIKPKKCVSAYHLNTGFSIYIFKIFKLANLDSVELPVSTVKDKVVFYIEKEPPHVPVQEVGVLASDLLTPPTCSCYHTLIQTTCNR